MMKPRGNGPRRHAATATRAAAVVAVVAVAIWWSRQGDGDPQPLPAKTALAETPAGGRAGDSSPRPVPAGDANRRRAVDDAGPPAAAGARFAGLVASDPARAAAELSQSSAGYEHDEWLPDIMANWVARSPAEAAGWVAALPAGGFKDAAREDLFYEWALADPAAAARHLEADLAAGGKASGITSLVGAWGATAPGEAAAWLSSLGGQLPRAAAGALAAVWAATDPLAASGWVESLPQGAPREAAAVNVVLGWPPERAGEAIAWLDAVEGIPDPVRTQASLAALGGWAAGPATADAIGWLDRQSDGAVKEQGKAIVSDAMADGHPAVALLVAGSIVDLDDRADSMAGVYDVWLAGDYHGAKVHLLEHLATLEDAAPMRGTLLDLLYHHDREFQRHALQKATE